MSLNTSGALLEGVRTASSNGSFTYPPRSVVTDPSAFAAVTSRGEYLVQAYHPTAYGTDLGDPQLVFYWSRNEGSVVRFDYDNFSRRWSPSPGGPPDSIGTFGNSPRLKAAPPDTSVPSAPYEIYLGSPVRSVTFSVQVVAQSAEFSNPPVGTVQISRDKAELNFSTIDLENSAYAGLTVYQSRQSFFDRTKTKGAIGAFPDGPTGEIDLFLNPKPGPGQIPRVRIGYGAYLSPVQVSDDSFFTTPAPGSFQWSAATGRLKFAPADVAANLSANVYYDGIFVGSFQLARYALGASAGPYPSAAFTVPAMAGNTDSSRFCLFSTVGGTRTYFQLAVGSGAPTDEPSDGTAYVDSGTGRVYLSSGDSSSLGGSVVVVDLLAPVDKGVGIQFHRSGVNVSGVSVEPDVTIRYQVNGQVIVDGIMASPFAMLPTVPVVDSYLRYSVNSGPGSTGTFTGDLVAGSNPSSTGFGYELDLDNKKISFCNRKSVTITLPKSQSQIKLPDSMVFSGGLEMTLDGQSVTPGVDFDFNATAGLIEFITPVGENDPGNVLEISGSFDGSTFTAQSTPFLPAHASGYLFVRAGQNAGVWKVSAVVSSHVVRVEGAFPHSGSGVADLRVEAEIVADRFWQSFVPPLRKFSMVRTNPNQALSFTYGPLDCTVLQNTAQVNLNSGPAMPGDIFHITYISLDSPDFGVTVTPTHRTEYAAFKIRQETATTVAGSPHCTINPDGKTVDTDHPMKVYVDGVTQEAGQFTFTAPGTVTLSQPVASGQTVVVDYFVREATGGETNFNLLHSPVDVDYPQIVAGSESGTYNGDQRSLLVPGGAFLVDGKDVVIISDVSYDASSDTTTAKWAEPPAVGTQPNSGLQVCGPISGSDYMVRESSVVDPLPKNSSSMSVQGNQPYVAGTVITVNGDPYYVTAAKYDEKSGKTTVMLGTPAYYTYVLPRVTRTVRPVLASGGSFHTSEPAHTGYPFHLVLGGKQNKILVKGVDFQVAEGGAVTLTDSLVAGDTLYALYVGRLLKPAGTSLALNYAYGIAPNDQNGLKGQQLIAYYNLLSPDTFFFRVETVLSFIPEVIQELKKSSAGGSGPNTSSASSMKTKDYGSPSLYFDEQHYGNIDVVLVRLLKYYNDLINMYEDLLADFDGRVVGGQSGRFRFDGNTNNPARTSYAGVTNDIDDEVVLYYGVTLTGFFSFGTAPIYGLMWQSNNYSRFFPTVKSLTVALNGNVGSSNFGKVLGSLGLKNVTSTSVMTSTRAVSRFSAYDNSGTNVLIQQNGVPASLVPPFASGQHFQTWTSSGAPDVTGTISGVTPVTGGVILALSAPTTLLEGSISTVTSDPTVTSNHFYTPGRDLAVNNDNGQITNATLALPAPLNNIQVAVVGNELVDATVTYQNSDTAPYQFPALNGLPQNDSGTAAVPALFYAANETDLLAQESQILSGFTTAQVASDMLTVTVGVTAQIYVGDHVQFVAGPNSGTTATVQTIVSTSSSGTIFTVSAALTAADAVGSNAIVIFHRLPSISSVLSQELAVASTVTATAPSGSSAIGTVLNELATVVQIMTSFGTSLATGSGGAFTASALTDSTDFEAAGVVAGSYVVVTAGPSTGMYKVASVAGGTISLDPAAPVPTPGSYSYIVIQPWGFLGPKEFAFPNAFVQSTLAWVASTTAWSSAWTTWSTASLSARTTAVAQRQSDITGFIKQVSGLLGKDDNLYNSRYLWISSRIDQKNGYLFKKSQAANKRADATSKLLQDQQKLLITQKLA